MEKPKKMKFVALTTTKNKPARKVENKKETTTVPTSKSLQVQLDEKGIPNSISGVLEKLPKSVKDLIGNAGISYIKSTHSLTHIQLDNKLSIKINERVTGGKRVYMAEIKQEKKIVFNKQIKQ